MDLCVELSCHCHEDVLVAKHSTLEMNDIARIFAQPTEKERQLYQQSASLMFLETSPINLTNDMISGHILQVVKNIIYS